MLKSLGHIIEEATTDRAAVRSMERNDIDLVLAGVDPLDAEALELLMYVRRKHREVPGDSSVPPASSGTRQRGAAAGGDGGAQVPGSGRRAPGGGLAGARALRELGTADTAVAGAVPHGNCGQIACGGRRRARDTPAVATRPVLPRARSARKRPRPRFWRLRSSRRAARRCSEWISTPGRLGWSATTRAGVRSSTSRSRLRARDRRS